MVRPLVLTSIASFAVAALPIAALAEQGAATPSYASHEDSIKGRVTSFDGHFDLHVRDDRGDYVDTVRLHEGTIINPRGLRLVEGMSVTILGHANGSSFDANEIDTPYSEDQSYAYGSGGYNASSYAFGVGCCYGYGYGYPDFGVSYYGAGGYGYGGYGYGGYGYGGYPIYVSSAYGYGYGGYEHEHDGYGHGGYGNGGYGYNNGNGNNYPYRRNDATLDNGRRYLLGGQRAAFPSRAAFSSGGTPVQRVAPVERAAPVQRSAPIQRSAPAPVMRSAPVSEGGGARRGI